MCSPFFGTHALIWKDFILKLVRSRIWVALFQFFCEPHFAFGKIIKVFILESSKQE